MSPSYLKRRILNVRRATRQRRVVGQKPRTVRVCPNASGRAGPKCDRKTEVHGWRGAGREGVREGKVFADEVRASPANRLSRPRQVRQLCRTLPAAIRRTPAESGKRARHIAANRERGSLDATDQHITRPQTEPCMRSQWHGDARAGERVRDCRDNEKRLRRGGWGKMEGGGMNRKKEGYGKRAQMDWEGR